PRGDRVEGCGRADLLPPEPRPERIRGDEHDRERIHRADRQGAPARVRGRAQPADPAGDGGVGRIDRLNADPAEEWAIPDIVDGEGHPPSPWAGHVWP